MPFPDPVQFSHGHIYCLAQLWTHLPGPLLLSTVRTRGQRHIIRSQEKPYLSFQASDFISQLRAAHAATLSWPTEFLLIQATNPTGPLLPEEDPLLSQRGQGAPLSDKHLHQMCREPLTPLNAAHAHFLAGGEGKVLRVLLANPRGRAVDKLWVCCILEAWATWIFLSTASQIMLPQIIDIPRIETRFHTKIGY